MRSIRHLLIVPLLVLVALALQACIGTTKEGEKRQQTAFGTFINVDTKFALADGTIVPFILNWDTGTDKGIVDIRAYSPACLANPETNTGDNVCLLFWYHAENVSHVETVLDTLVKVKGAIAERQLEMGADVAAGLMRAITAIALPSVLLKP